MVKVYACGKELVDENLVLLNSNPYLAIFFYLDAKYLMKTDKKNYALRVETKDGILLAMKMEPFSLLLFGSGDAAGELVDFLMENDYQADRLLGAEPVCDRVAEVFRNSRGILYEEALAMDFMEAAEITEPSAPEVEIPDAADLDELFACEEAFKQDCGLQESTDRGNLMKKIGSYRIIRMDGQIVSMAAFDIATPDAMKIASVYTKPEYRGKGIARKVVNSVKNEILAQGKVATLNVDKKNPVSNHLYESLGFRKVFSQGEYRRV